MTPSRLLKFGITPALTELEQYGIPNTMAARRFLLTIALQESALKHRRQVTSGGQELGPASSFWQFEKNGGCRGVLDHPATSEKMRTICADFNVEPTPLGLWEAMRYHDVVAAAAARLLVYTLPSKLPATAPEGWAQYIQAWRPGKPHMNTWASYWDLAGLVAIGEK